LGAAALAVLFLAFGWLCATRSVDFPIYHRIATQILAGNYELYPGEVYDGGPVPSHGFRYAPAVAFLFVPFGFLPLEASAFVFFLIKAVALVYTGALVVAFAGRPGAHRVLIPASLVFVGGYVVEEFLYGNFHFFTVTLMAAVFVAAERGRVVLPAAALAIAITAKLTPIALLGYFALRRRTAVCVATIAMLGALWVLPAAVVGIRMNNRLTRGFVLYALQKADESDNYSLRGVLYRYLTPDHRPGPDYPRTSIAALSAPVLAAIWVSSLLAGTIVSTLALWRAPAARSILLLELSLVLTAILIASPHSQRRHFTSLFIPVLALLVLKRDGEPPFQRQLIRAGLAVTAAASTFLPMLFIGRRLALLYEAASPYFIATVVLFGVLLRLTIDLKAQEGESSPCS
jgi:hypothetical protein